MANALQGIKEHGDDVFEKEAAHEKEEEAEAVGKLIILNKLIICKVKTLIDFFWGINYFSFYLPNNKQSILSLKFLHE